MTASAVPVWDLPTRIFHWALVIAVVVSYVTGGEEGSWFVAHTVSGYVVALLLLFRLVWGFWGSAHSRFSDFIYSLGSVGAYVRRLVRLDPPETRFASTAHSYAELNTESLHAQINHACGPPRMHLESWPASLESPTTRTARNVL